MVPIILGLGWAHDDLYQFLLFGTRLHSNGPNPGPNLPIVVYAPVSLFKCSLSKDNNSLVFRNLLGFEKLLHFINAEVL